MKDSKVERARQGAAMLRRQFLQGGAEAFGRVLGDREVALVVSELVEPYRERIYRPLDTLRLFVGQVLSADRACQDVVSRRLSERIAQGQSGSALNTGSYCDARQRLPVALPIRLGATIGERLESHEQKPGLGFPIARIGALIGLASGAILGYQVVACEGKGTGCGCGDGPAWQTDYQLYARPATWQERPRRAMAATV